MEEAFSEHISDNLYEYIEIYEDLKGHYPYFFGRFTNFTDFLTFCYLKSRGCIPRSDKYKNCTIDPEWYSEFEKEINDVTWIITERTGINCKSDIKDFLYVNYIS
jgi:hypothetical protein